jgi:hypothetical protein
MKQYILAKSYFPLQHTGSAMFEKLEVLLEEWNFTVLICIVTDNARHMVISLQQDGFLYFVLPT